MPSAGLAEAHRGRADGRPCWLVWIRLWILETGEGIHHRVSSDLGIRWKFWPELESRDSLAVGLGEVTRASACINDVVASAAADGSLGAFECVVAATAPQSVVSTAAADAVSSPVAREPVVRTAAYDRFDRRKDVAFARSAVGPSVGEVHHDASLALRIADGVDSGAAVEDVRPRARIADAVIAVAIDDLVVTFATSDLVPPAASSKPIMTPAPDKAIIAGAAVERVAKRSSSRTGLQVVIAWAAAEEICEDEGCARQLIVAVAPVDNDPITARESFRNDAQRVIEVAERRGRGARRAVTSLA